MLMPTYTRTKWDIWKKDTKNCWNRFDSLGQCKPTLQILVICLSNSHIPHLLITHQNYELVLSFSNLIWSCSILYLLKILDAFVFHILDLITTINFNTNPYNVSFSNIAPFSFPTCSVWWDCFSISHSSTFTNSYNLSIGCHSIYSWLHIQVPYFNNFKHFLSWEHALSPTDSSPSHKPISPVIQVSFVANSSSHSSQPTTSNHPRNNYHMLIRSKTSHLKPRPFLAPKTIESHIHQQALKDLNWRKAMEIKY